MGIQYHPELCCGMWRCTDLIQFIISLSDTLGNTDQESVQTQPFSNVTGKDLPGSVQFNSVTQSCLTLCDPQTAALQASLSIINSRSLLKLMSTESVMPSNHLILCHPLLLLFSIFPSIRVFSNESALHIRWPKYWSFSFNISPSMIT